jgi:hypothetical protein
MIIRDGEQKSILDSRETNSGFRYQGTTVLPRLTAQCPVLLALSLNNAMKARVRIRLVTT